MGNFCRLIKQLITSAILVQSVYSQVYHIDVEEFKRTDMEYIFEIVNRDFEKVTVDCQGFINMVALEHYSGDKENLILDVTECEDILFKIYENTLENIPSCLMTNLDQRRYSVTSKHCK